MKADELQKDVEKGAMLASEANFVPLLRFKPHQRSGVGGYQARGQNAEKLDRTAKRDSTPFMLISAAPYRNDR